MTTVDHDCVQVRFALAKLSSLACALICNGAAWLLFKKTESCCTCKRNFNISSLQYEQKEAAVQLLWSKVVAILPAGFEESLIYQLYATAKEMQIYKC